MLFVRIIGLVITVVLLLTHNCLLCSPENNMENVVIIVFDDETLKYFGGKIENRIIDAEVIDKLQRSDARCIFYDFHFFGASGNKYADNLLIDTVSRSNKLILPRSNEIRSKIKKPYLFEPILDNLKYADHSLAIGDHCSIKDMISFNDESFYSSYEAVIASMVTGKSIQLLKGYKIEISISDTNPSRLSIERLLLLDMDSINKIVAGKAVIVGSTIIGVAVPLACVDPCDKPIWELDAIAVVANTLISTLEKTPGVGQLGPRVAPASCCR